MEAGELQEHRDRMYRTIVNSSAFESQLKTFNTYLSDYSTNQRLQVAQNGGVSNLFGMLKIYWGTQKVIRLKKEELSWKRKSTRLAYENGLDDKLVSASGGGLRNRQPPIRVRDETESSQDLKTDRNSDGHLEFWNSMTRDAARADDDHDEDDDVMEMGIKHRIQKSGTIPRRVNLQRRTMSFSGHLYNSKTAVFRPKYGTVSHVRVSSQLTTYDVIGMLLRKFAVENLPEEFNLYWVSQSGETHAFQPNDFPLLKRVQLGPDESVSKIFIMEKKSDEISLEVAAYVNLRVPELEAILRKFQEEEEKEVMKIEQRYVQYRATLKKKMDVLAAEIAKESKSKGKRKGEKKKKGKDKGKGKKK